MVYYKTMDKWIMCIVALILGMLMYHMLKSVCGCKTVEGSWAGAWSHISKSPAGSEALDLGDAFLAFDTHGMSVN
jgi:hypothetical protein